jgi:proton-dependent oligopeptide transporter, POT family
VSNGTVNRDNLLGHPKGLFVLFFTELWERFSFYSMRGILTLYTAGVVLAALGSEAGGRADAIYGAYLGFVYSSTFIGGMLADRLLGQRRAIYIGGTLMALAQFTLAGHALLVKDGTPVASLNWLFFLGLGLLAAGNGFFKPNISTIVGTLYEQGDGRRDAAFTIFYMGINIGAFLASFSAGLAQKYGWHLGFLLAGVGMIVGQLIFLWGRGTIEGKGMPPEGASLRNVGRLGVSNGIVLTLGIAAFIPLVAYLISHPQWVQSLALIIAGPIVLYLLWEATRGSREEAARMIVILVLCTFSMMFWGFFELAGSTITRFTEEVVNRNVFGTEVQAAFLANFVNPLLIIALSIPAAALWVWLDRRRLEPSSPLKFVLGPGVPVAGIRNAVAGRQGGAGVGLGQMRDDLADPGLLLPHHRRTVPFAGGPVHHYQVVAGAAGGHVHGSLVLVQRVGQRARPLGRRGGRGRRF